MQHRFVCEACLLAWGSPPPPLPTLLPCRPFHIILPFTIFAGGNMFYTIMGRTIKDLKIVVFMCRADIYQVELRIELRPES